METIILSSSPKTGASLDKLTSPKGDGNPEERPQSSGFQSLTNSLPRKGMETQEPSGIALIAIVLTNSLPRKGMETIP